MAKPNDDPQPLSPSKTNDAFIIVFEHLLRASETDAALRSAVLCLAERAIVALSLPSTAGVSASLAPPAADAALAAADAIPNSASGDPTTLVRTQGSSPRLLHYLGTAPTPRPEPSPVEYPERCVPKEALGARVDLELVARRLRMKADGARWAAERRRLLTEAADYATHLEPNDRETIRRAKEIPGCYLWTNGPNSPAPADFSVFEVLAECYDNAAAAAELVRRLDELETPSTDPSMQRAFHLMAEAQSALRVAAMRAEGPEDPDQFEIFQWLKTNTRDREIYVGRHMRVNDPADPGDRRGLSARIAGFGEELYGRLNR